MRRSTRSFRTEVGRSPNPTLTYPLTNQLSNSIQKTNSQLRKNYSSRWLIQVVTLARCPLRKKARRQVCKSTLSLTALVTATQ